VARIVCQVLHRADRITFIWSEGSASFEPYHVEGAEQAALLSLADRIHVAFATPDSPELTPLGQQLYRMVFRMDADDQGSAPAVQAWLTGLINSGSVEKIEFLSDRPGLIPWNVLVDDPASGLWGRRFSLAAGRRVNTLRQNPAEENPMQLFAADPQLVEQLGEDQRALFKALADDRPVASASDLEARISDLAPDILLVLVRLENGQMWLGRDTFSVADLERWMGAPKDGNPDPLILLLGCGDLSERAAWHALLAEATAAFSGVIAAETLLSAPEAFAVGHAIARRFVEGTHNLGEILRTLRQENPTALAFDAFCPPQVRAVGEGATDGPQAELPVDIAPLPRLPYHPFAPYGPEDRALFFGRENDSVRGASAIDHADTLGMIVHGGPGVGKTSFLQAGLFPYLEQECVGFQFLRDRTPSETPVAEKDQPVLVLRATNDLAGQFADALLAFCAAPLTYTTPAGAQVTVDLPELLQKTATGTKNSATTAIQAGLNDAGITQNPGQDDAQAAQDAGLSINDLWLALRDNKETLGRILDAVTRVLPFELVIAIDEGEELLTQASSEQQQSRRQKAIDMLTQLSRVAPRCKLIFIIRTHHLGQFVGLFPDGRTPEGWSTFFLRPLTGQEMVDALVWPTNREPIPYCSETPFQKYRFAFEEAMAPILVADAVDAGRSDQQSPLAILHAVGALLYESQVLIKKQSVLRVGDINDLGGVRDAVANYLDFTLDRLNLTMSAQQALRDLIAKLYMSHSDGTLSRKIILAGDLGDCWSSPGDPALPNVTKAADQAGLFHVHELLIGGTIDTYVSVAQDSLVQLGRKLDAQKEKDNYAWTKIGDTLWIMIPLMFLAAAATFWATRHYNPAPDAETIAEKIETKYNKLLNDALKRYIQEIDQEQRPPLYHAQMASAQLAMRAGNPALARKMLDASPAIRNIAEIATFPDLRGFDWKHLWHRLNSERHGLDSHRGSVQAIAVSQDGKRAVTGGADGEVRIWNLQKGRLITSISATAKKLTVALAPDGKTLAAAGDDKIVRVWDLSELKDDAGTVTKEPKKLEGHTDAVHALAFGKDATQLASAGADKTIIIWDMATGKGKHTLKEHTAAVKALVFTSDAKALVSAGDEARIMTWDPATGKQLKAKATPHRTIAALALSGDGKMLASAGTDASADVDGGSVRFWNPESLDDANAPILHGPNVLAVAFAPDGKSVIAAGVDPVVRQWDLKTRTEQKQWMGHSDSINALAYVKDFIISASADGTSKVWDPARISDGVDIIAAHKAPVVALALSRDSSLLASGARDGSVKLWNPKTNKLVAELAPHSGPVTSLAFSSHREAEIGKAKDKEEFLLAVGTRNAKNEGEIKIWQIKRDGKDAWTAKDPRSLPQHTAGVTSLAFCPTDTKADTLVSGSTDNAVKVWDAKAGKLIETHTRHKAEVRCVAFTTDGTIFGSGAKDGSACLYRLGEKTTRFIENLQRGSIDSIVLYDVDIQRNEEGVHATLTIMITGGSDLAIRYWRFDKGAARIGDDKDKPDARGFHAAHSGDVVGLAYNKNGPSSVFSASIDGTVKIFDRTAERLSLTGHQGPVRAVAVADDQRFIVSAGNDGTVRIWRTQVEPEPAMDEKK